MTDAPAYAGPRNAATPPLVHGSMRNPVHVLLLVLGLGSGVLHGQAPAGPAATVTTPRTVELPADVARVLRDYEQHFLAGDAQALATLFTEDGWVLSPGKPPRQGRAAIAAHYRGSRGPLKLRAMAWEADGRVGYILGGWRLGEASEDEGKFTLTLRRVRDRWLIVSDMDNRNTAQP